MGTLSIWVQVAVGEVGTPRVVGVVVGSGGGSTARGMERKEYIGVGVEVGAGLFEAGQ